MSRHNQASGRWSGILWEMVWEMVWHHLGDGQKNNDSIWILWVKSESAISHSITRNHYEQFIKFKMQSSHLSQNIPRDGQR